MSFFISASPIGLDISPRTVAAAQLSCTRGQWRLERASVVPRPTGTVVDGLSAPETERIADILSRQGFSGRDVVITIPDRKLMLSVLDLPPRASGAPIADLARAEMARTHRRTADSFELSCWDLPSPIRGNDGTHLMAAACSHVDATALLDPIEQAGLSVAALDLRAWAMARACERSFAGSADVVGLLDIGEAGASLALVHSGVVIYERSMPDAGIDAVRAKLAQALSLDSEASDGFFAQLIAAEPTPLDDLPIEVGVILRDHAQSIVRDLSASLTYAVHRYGGEVSRVLLCGAGARLNGLDARLTTELGAPASAAKPGDLVDCAPGLPVDDTALTVAIGLARHQLGRAA